jgi:O-antigen ligase
VLLWPAVVVIGFGLLQHFVLPVSFLSHVGYGPETIPASQTVDQKPQYVRVQSTLRGANPLGAYLIVVLAALWVQAVSYKRQRLLFGIVLFGGLTVLLFSYSRSAWLGAAIALVWMVWGTLPTRKVRRAVLLAGAIVILLGASGLYGLRHNDLIQNTVFHTDERSSSIQSSNAARADSLKTAIKDIVREPLGRGPGTAGPASFRNLRPARIAENYYLQIGQEVGVIGLGLFIAINLIIGWRLWRLRQQPLALVLLASFVGLSVVSMLSHAWADDTLAYLWWGLTGLVLGSNAAIHTLRTSQPAHQRS